MMQNKKVTYQLSNAFQLNESKNDLNSPVYHTPVLSFCVSTKIVSVAPQFLYRTHFDKENRHKGDSN